MEANKSPGGEDGGGKQRDGMKRSRRGLVIPAQRREGG